MRSHERSRPNLEVKHGRRQQALVMPGRNAVAVGSGGEKFKRRPGSSKQRRNRFVAAPRIKSPNCRRSRNEAKNALAQQQRFKMPRSETYQPELRNGLPKARCNASGWNREHRQRIGTAREIRTPAKTYQKATTQKPSAASRPSKLEGSKTHQQAAGWNSSGAANASSHSPDRNHAW